MVIVHSLCQLSDITSSFESGALFILFFLSPQEGSPAVIVLEQLNCLAALASIFDLSILDNKNW